MVKSKRCKLRGMNNKELIKNHEEEHELGGYFIINGLEKIIRFLILPRRNDVVAIYRPSFSRLGSIYTPYCTMIRCVRKDQSSQTITLHYLSDGNCNVRFILGRQEFFIPIVILLKSLIETTDKEIYLKIIQDDFENTFLSDRIEMLLRETKKLNLYTKEQCLSYIGNKFRIMLKQDFEDFNDQEIAEFLIQKNILVHLDNNQSKFELFMY